MALPPPEGKGGRDPGDVNGDGDDDLAVDLGHDIFGPGRVELFHGGGSGLRRSGKTTQRLGPATSPTGRKESGSNRRAELQTAADYDGDGRDELALTWSAPHSEESGWERGLSVWWITDGTHDETVFGTGGW
ncbi:hypothetical protein ACIBCT_24290 [Streptosporangium sp. NPDC050855]|uniref:hypothetical protein n=1 Tax=Streptosporangium sp. NPDC050855 TaxID=3366194 RepID=UPI0037ABD991